MEKTDSPAKEFFTYRGVKYDVTFGNELTRHGGPFDRGSADSYYCRGCSPHYFIGRTHSSPRIGHNTMNEKESLEYYAGFEYNENVIQAWKEW